jgi:hypothetical protein
VASFWDDPPGSFTAAGHIAAVLTQVLADQNASLPKAAESYARVTIAVADAGISVWSTKYTDNLLRPVTYIHNYIDDGWPFLNTPPFPEYSSGHAGFAGAGFTALTEIFGNDFGYTDRTEDAMDANQTVAPRSFASFNEAALEDGLSRWYGGVHYLSSVDTGLAQGRCLAARTSTLRIGASDGGSGSGCR